MRVVLFDDNESDRKHLAGIIERWNRENGEGDLILYEYSQIGELEFALPDILLSDVFFLDIMTPESETAGLRLAETIHIQNPTANIIFTTNSPEYWKNAFEILALHYLIKPIQTSEIDRLLDLVSHSPSMRGTRVAVFQSNKQKVFIGSDRILYIEAIKHQHRAIAYLTDKTKMEVSFSQASLSGLLVKELPPEFAQCHRSFIVNLRYVIGYDDRSLILKNVPAEIPIGRNFQEQFVALLIDYQKRLRLL